MGLQVLIRFCHTDSQEILIENRGMFYEQN